MIHVLTTATTADSLRDLGAALAAHTGAALPYAIRDWDEAVRAIRDTFPAGGAFLGIDNDPELAVLVHSIVGGTPAYRSEFVADDVPASRDDFDSWVGRTVLNPAIPLFREARCLLAGETDIREPALYNSVLGAIAAGNATRGGIANYVGRKSSEVLHPLNVLEDAGLIARKADPFHARRSLFRIAELRTPEKISSATCPPKWRPGPSPTPPTGPRSRWMSPCYPPGHLIRHGASCHSARRSGASVLLVDLERLYQS